MSGRKAALKRMMDWIQGEVEEGLLRCLEQIVSETKGQAALEVENLEVERKRAASTEAKLRKEIHGQKKPRTN